VRETCAFARCVLSRSRMWRDAFHLRDDLCIGKEKAGEGSRRQGADSYETDDSRRVTVGQGELRSEVGK